MTPAGLPHATVYVDESYNREDHTFVLLGVIVPQAVEAELRARWAGLQREIHRVLLVDYPLAQTHFAKHPDVLAEVHAVNLFQSSGYYAKHPRRARSTEPYWLQHYDWLERAFAVQADFTLDVLAIELADTRLLDSRLQGQTRVSDLLRPLVSTAGVAPAQLLEGMFSEMDRLEARPFTSALPRLVTAAGRRLSERGFIGDMVCDEDEENKRFATTRSSSGSRELLPIYGPRCFVAVSARPWCRWLT